MNLDEPAPDFVAYSQRQEADAINASLFDHLFAVKAQDKGDLALAAAQHPMDRFSLAGIANIHLVVRIVTL
jgi:hypothetical protein